MSNNNKFWGKRFGSYNEFIPKGQKEPWGFVFPTAGYGSKNSNSSKSVKTKDTPQAKADRKAYQDRVALEGKPVLVYNWKGKRIA